MTDLAYVSELLHQYGYVVILGWTFLEGETIVIIAGFLSNKGVFNPWLVALCAFSGSFCSDQVMFALGKYKGASVLTRFPKIEQKSAKVRYLMRAYEIPLILGFRFVYGVRNITPILLGVSGVSHLKFFCLNFIGAAVWALTFTFGGYYFGHLFDKATKHIANAEVWLIGILAAAGILFLLVRRYRQKHEVTHALQVAKVEPPVNTPAFTPETTSNGKEP